MNIHKTIGYLKKKKTYLRIARYILFSEKYIDNYNILTKKVNHTKYVFDKIFYNIEKMSSKKLCYYLSFELRLTIILMTLMTYYVYYF